ncbi:MAG: hypothetical protein M3R15_26605 [Acidobacteriota bacterium]|nr:hypothetical protein [Acidobacteriota bacterium]
MVSESEIFKATVYAPIGSYTYDKLKEIHTNLRKGDEKNLNHDLQQAARKAQLTATLLAVRACLAETRRLNANKKSLWSKASGLIQKDADEKWLNELADLWQQKIKDLSEEPPLQIVEEDQLIGLFDPKLNLAPTEIQNKLVENLKEDALKEIRTEYTSVSPLPEAASKLLEEAIKTGWNEFADDAAYVTSLNLYRPEQKRALINTDKQYDWFSLVCGLFNEEYKNNKSVEAAMQKYLLLDIRDRQTGVPLDPKAVADLLAGHLAQFGDSFVRLEGLLKTIDAKQDGILNFVTSRFEDLARRIDEVKQTVEKTAAETQQTVVDVGGKVEQVVKEKGDELKEELPKLVVAALEEKEAREKAAIEKEKERETKRRARQSLATAGTVIGSFSFVRPTKFLDRKKEYAELQQKVFEGASPIVVIKGAGGFGKTTLAEHFLKQAAPQNKITDGRVKEIVIFNCQFGEGTLDRVITRADELLERAGTEDELRVPLREIFKQQTSDEQKILTLFEHLRRLGTIWFFFDNLESVLTAENHLGDKSLEKLLALALHAKPDLRVILTTREEPLFDGCDRVATVKMEGKLPPADALAYLQQLAAEGRINWRVPLEAEEARLAELAEKLGYVPKALFSFAEYFNQKRKQPLKLSTILQSTEIFADFKQHDFERGYAKLIGEQFTVLSELEQAVWKVLSVFRKPATSAAIEYMMSGYKLDGVWELLHASGLIVVQEVEVGEQVDYAYGLEQSAQDYVYQFLPADEQTAFFNQRALHEKAADYYAQTRLPKEQWKTIEDFASQFEEMYHCRQAGLYDRAAIVLDKEPSEFLGRAGYSRRLLEEQ